MPPLSKFIICEIHFQQFFKHSTLLNVEPRNDYQKLSMLRHDSHLHPHKESLEYCENTYVIDKCNFECYDCPDGEHDFGGKKIILRYVSPIST